MSNESEANIRMSRDALNTAWNVIVDAENQVDRAFNIPNRDLVKDAVRRARLSIDEALRLSEEVAA